MIDGGAERAPDQALDLHRPSALLAAGGFALHPVGGRPRQHPVFRRDPAPARPLEERRDLLLHRRRAEHPRLPDFDERGAFRVLDPSGADHDRPQLVVRAPVFPSVHRLRFHALDSCATGDRAHAVRPYTRERLFLEDHPLRHDDDPGSGDREPLAVELRIVSDHRARRDADALVDDRAADPRVAADVDPVHQNRFVDVGERVDPHPRMKDRPVDRPAGDDHAVRDQRVGRETDPVALLVGEDELRRRKLQVRRQDRPAVVVEVERRRDLDQVHRRGEVRLDRPDVAPVPPAHVVLPRHHVLREVVRVDVHLRVHLRDDLLAEVVRRVPQRVVLEDVDHHVRLEDVVAHRREDHVRPSGDALRPLLRLLHEADHLRFSSTSTMPK